MMNLHKSVTEKTGDVPLFMKIEEFKKLGPNEYIKQLAVVQEMLEKTSPQAVLSIVRKRYKDINSLDGIISYLEKKLEIERKTANDYKDYIVMENTGHQLWKQLSPPDTFANTHILLEDSRIKNPTLEYRIMKTDNLEAEVCQWIKHEDFHIEINRDYLMVGIRGKYHRLPMSDEVDLIRIIQQAIEALRES